MARSRQLRGAAAPSRTHLHVADDGAVGVVEELNAHLDGLTLGASAAEDLGDLQSSPPENASESVYARSERRRGL